MTCQGSHSLHHKINVGCCLQTICSQTPVNTLRYADELLVTCAGNGAKHSFHLWFQASYSKPAWGFISRARPTCGSKHSVLCNNDLSGMLFHSRFHYTKPACDCVHWARPISKHSFHSFWHHYFNNSVILVHSGKFRLTVALAGCLWSGVILTIIATCKAPFHSDFPQ